jgi:molecular chaperone DnaK (HSP70)
VAATYSVGIDLGTTHTVVAYARLDGGQPIRVLEIERLVAPGQIQSLPTLPSVLYAPLPEEAAVAASQWLVGDYARRRGQQVSSRSIVSAKSWLCHGAVDRHAAILPWGAGEGLTKLSPVEASTRILEHVRASWNSRFPDSPLAEQLVILTVPASFDPVARQLTVTAAAAAGLSVRLLEEPQSAFYDYLDRCGTGLLQGFAAKTDDHALRVFVCDVGGGTTDLTLLRVYQKSADLFVDRIAVGKHLLLGGDNMDLSLAHLAESTLGANQRFDAQDLVKWVLACREAKEQLLRSEAPSEVRVAVGSSGAQLVGHSRSVGLTKVAVRSALLDGFFPLIEAAVPPAPKRSALLGFGLPYEVDPSISVHIAAFLARHLSAHERVDALLLNGGVFLAPLLAERVVHVLERLGHTGTLLPNLQPDLAVARGAANYGLVLQGHGLRIGGGCAHGYYAAFESRAARRSAICVVPRGSAEGEKHRALSQRFTLRTGVPVRFELYSSDIVVPHAAGTLVDIDDQFELLPPIVTQIVADSAASDELTVHLEGELTAVGSLELHCVPVGARGIESAYRLAFELRGQERGDPATERPAKASRQERAAEAYELIQRVFGKGRSNVEARETKDLVRNLERILGCRNGWTLELSRSLFDVIGPKFKARLRSLDHERLYFMLAGFTLRPGFGHALDRQRVALLGPVFAEGLTHVDQVRSWQQFLIAWRRVLPGMTELEQTRAFELLVPLVSKSRNRTKPPKGFQGIVQPELLDLVSLFERLAPSSRIDLGSRLIERTWTEREPRLWQAVGRLGARVPLYASAHYVIAPREVESWIEQLMRESWEQLPNAAEIAVNMTRLTGDRARDVSDTVRKEVLLRLARLKVPDEWTRQVSEVVPVAASETLQQYGEELPVGLVWHGEDE